MGSFADAIVSNSVAGDHYWSSRAGRRVRRYVIPNGLPLREIERSPAASSDDAGIAPGEILVLFAGRLDELKNAALFVRAIAQVRPSLPVRAMICGEGPLYPEIERLIAEFNLERRVRLTGYTSHLWSLMKRANVLVSTSLCEGNPNVVLEAMACRCPLVVSDIEAHLEILDEHSALMVAPADVNGFARSIEQVIDRPDEAAERARAAAARSERHALPLIARQYVSVYTDVVSQHRAKDVVI
jgi:glycosyltransferase involved in cell wall biosynthesis